MKPLLWSLVVTAVVCSLCLFVTQWMGLADDWRIFVFGMNIYHVPIVPIFIMIFLVGLLQIVLSCVLSSNLKKETLVERIRYQG